jgi:hypothetical protein
MSAYTRYAFRARGIEALLGVYSRAFDCGNAP